MTVTDNHTPELWEDIQNNEYDPAEYDFSREAEIYLEDYETGHGDVYVKNLVVAKPPVTCKPKPGLLGFVPPPPTHTHTHTHKHLLCCVLSFKLLP